VGLVQNDIKRVIAYSTCSQLGYMFVALGVGAYQVAIFHLFTHAFFKSLLFLGSGSVIHALSDEQDIRKMGGLAKLIPFTWLSMIIGTLALTGAPFLSGYYSKDGIIEAAYLSHSSGHLYAFYLLVFSVFLTSFYSWRLILLTFHGTTKTPNEILTKVHESPLTMTAPLFLLSLGSIFSGFFFADFFMSVDFQPLWTSSLYLGSNSEIIDSIHRSPSWVKALPLVMMLAGLLMAMFMYVFFKSLPKSLSKRFSFFYNFLLNKWYFDEIYDLLFVKSSRKIGNFLSLVFDKGIIDGIGPDGISLRVQQLAKYASKLQTGFIYHYALAMLVGLTAFIFLFVIFG
jgi:NADH-quinone oxidoreductase subunit L